MDHHNAPPHQHPQSDHRHDGATGTSATAMAISATLHCLTGCAIGEVLGLLIGTVVGLGSGGTIVLAIALAFGFGYSLSILPLLRAGLGMTAALGLVLAADTLSIATMELVDNAVMTAIPGAMGAGLADTVFWVGMLISLAAAFVAAVPVNRWLLQRGKGHALTHGHHGGGAAVGARRFIPDLSTGALVAAVVAFLLGGLVVSTAADLDQDRGSGASSHASTTSR